MAIPRGHRFTIQFDSAFPQGLVLIGDIAPDNEYQTREDKAAGRPVRQKIDNDTGKRQRKATVTDPDEPNAKRASYEITFIADVQPVPTITEVLPGMRPIELDGLTAEPRVAGNGEFKYQSYVYRATGFTATTSAAGARSSQSIKPTGGAWAVAAAWRQIAAATTLPWWALAAIESAAAAFEAQAREYEAREGNDGHDRG